MKALYGLHQAPRAWFKTLAKYLLGNGFHKRKIDRTLFIKRQKGDILLIHVYVDDIIFGSTKKELCIEFEKLMKDKFQMSSMRELTFFLGLQVKQKEDEIFISQDKYVADILRRFNLTDVRTASTPMDTEKALLKDSDGDDVDVHFYRYLKGQPKLGLWYPRDFSFDLVAYSDSDYAGASLDMKSTTGGCKFLGCRLMSWQCKKQTVIATSSTEAEYVAAASCCGQVLCIQNQMLDYGINTAKHIEYLCVMNQTPRQLKRGWDIKIPQCSGPPKKVGDEAVHKELGDIMERAATTASSLEAEQDSDNINMTQSMATLNEQNPTKKCHLLAHGFRKIISYDISKEKPMSNKELESKVEDMVEEVKTKMGELFGTYKERFDFLSSNSSMGEHMESEVTSPNNGDNDFLNDYYNVDATSSYETETELDRYLREPKIELRKDILAIQISTVASEAAFSMGGRILDPYRTRLSTTIVEALICTQDWVRKSRTQINWDDVEDLIKDDEIVKDMEEQLEKLTERDKAKQTGEI
ncbi:putative ribonuclease H-like domain-containing protein [Tanacetum coccineum]